jgi:methionine aminopeptidase type I
VPAVPPDEVPERMRAAGRAAREVLLEVGAAVAAGVTTDALDRICHDAYIARGGYPSTLDYKGYPKSLCTSVNEVICHGIPDDRALQDGDIVNCDVTIYLHGVHGDCSETFLVGDVDDAGRGLVQTTYESLWKGIDAVKPGGRIYEIGRAIQTHAEAGGFSVVRSFVGHGVGETFHTAPSVPHFFDPHSDTVIEPGMTFTIEPCPACCMCGIAARAHHIGAVRSTRSIASHAGVDRSPTGPSGPSPPAALLTSTVSPFIRSAAAATSCVMACSSPRSAARKTASPPLPAISATTASPRVWSRPVTTTAAPSRASSMAIARPMPEVEPVTTAFSPPSRTHRRYPSDRHSQPAWISVTTALKFTPVRGGGALARLSG